MGYIQQGAAKDSGGIMVNHDIHRYTAETLDAILTMLEEQGYSFVNLDDTSVFPRLNGLTPPPEPWVGAPCADDAACSFSGSGRSASCHAWSPTESSEIYGFCSIPCQGTCPDKAGWASTFCVTLDGGSTGNCVAKAGAANDGCAKIPGTTARVMQRFVGTSSAAPASATVCVP
jgi:hypothetical protein